MADFSEEHVGKRVLAQSGAELGTVAEVRDGDLYVEVVSELNADDAISQLGWDGAVNQDTHHLPDQYVSNVTDSTIRLRV